MNTTPKRTNGGSKAPSTTPKRTPSDVTGQAVKRKTSSVPKKTVIAPGVRKAPVSNEQRRSSVPAAEKSPVRETPLRTDTAAVDRVQDKASGNASRLGFELGLNRKTVTLAVILLLVIANLVAIFGIKQGEIPERLTPDQVANASKIDLEKLFQSPFEDAKIPSSDYKKGTLVLINGTYDFDVNHKGQEIPDPVLVQVNRNIKDRTFKARDNTTQLSQDTVNALNLMFADFKAQGGRRDVMVNEAYRSIEAQQKIFDAKVKQLGKDQKIAQKPGFSEHHTGYAVDFSIYPDGGKGARTFTREDHYAWIYDNCHKYGFVLRYPENKTDITGISPESWHFRYVGVPHASYMYERGITLEEYLSEIRIYTENVPLVFKSNGVEYGAYYVKRGTGAHTEFKVPREKEYFISGDNVGGFVVWYKTGNADVDTNEEAEENTDNGENTDNA